MEAEDDFKRPAPIQPYKPVTQQLCVPAAAIDATIVILRRAGRRESGLFWYGPRDAQGNGTVRHVVAPKQQMSRGNYHIAADALAAVVHSLPNGWKPLAQVHSHPGIGVEHSNYDDRMVSSRRALSLVFPFYGLSDAPFPSGIGVHEWQGDYWHLLDDVLATRRIVSIDGTVTVEDRR